MGHHHGHGVATTTGSYITRRRPLAAAFALTAAFMIIEFAVGASTGSLALLSDAAHMGTDVLALGMSLAAVSLAARPATKARTYGSYRLEVLAALANGLVLFAVAGFVIAEAVRRFAAPPTIPGSPLLITATLGLMVNLISLRLLSAGAKESILLRGASLEVLGDALGSIGVIVAALLLLVTGWAWADPIVGVLIGILILPRTWSLTRQALAILMESAPAHIDLAAIEQDLCAVSGVLALHDLHVWTITSGRESASGHIVMAPDADYHAALGEVLMILRERHGIDHATIQCEPEEFPETTHACRDTPGHASA
ncbi:cation diffusion facilitator family transporter [Rathayibacter toxicus]|uniref:Cation transporter n=1 Tax=Rathayibacter toxicus TaxID=145458 RepID=A0A0C5BFM2_9MICO|nr:cation diffusion facilitator family transporter [Rathayibacter toxicus]AJM76970.1 cation transporter [Rathayibacter toxicus]ALS57244.1 cation transporter [Rathayibacter toxicus]KKM47233.1 cation transporter [Rathayibacter toxicus]PPG24034.1 cation transporter [Rathayibacter toxicus]PPG48072.1 cation transporter [Rathayibacter toxicus]